MPTLSRIIRPALALAAAAAVPLALAEPAEAQYAGQQVCRSASSSSDNDGGVRVYGAGYEQHPEQFYDLPKGRCWTFTTSAEARYGDVQLRGSGSARWRITNTSPDGPWHAFTGNRTPGPIASTYAHTVIEVDR